MVKMKKRRPPRQFILRKKFCLFCVEKSREIDYKDISTLIKFTTERGKIIPRRVSGVCAKHQRRLAMAMKQARIIALLPFVRQ
ncbi:MAG: 30S ribosomal protein S18 [Candidatus Omnitrophota bacterium]